MSYQNPFSTSDKYTNDKIKARVQARIKRVEQARNNLVKIEEKITDKDKYMTRRGQEPCSLPGYVSNKGGMEKVFDKYEKVSQGNQNYKEICDKKPQLDNYFKNYIDNTKVPKVYFVEEKKIYVDNKKRNQEQIVKDWDNQIKTDNGIRDRIEMNYQEKLAKDRNAYEEKYNKQAKIKRDKIKRNTEDYLNTNRNLIEDKKKKVLNREKNDHDYEVYKAKENQKEIDYINNYEKQYIKDQKAEFNRVLDDQNRKQKRKYQRLRDIEYGNF
jgi:hypothetical protein